MRLDKEQDTTDDTGLTPLRDIPPDRPRGRRGLLVAVALLALGSGVITAVVALSGPDFSDGARDSFPLALSSRDSAPLTPTPQPEQTPDAAVPDMPPGPDTSPGGVDPLPEPMPDLGAPDEGYQGSGSLRVVSSPPNASVYLDDVYQCNTPCTVEELGSDQIYLLSVRRKRYQRWSKLVDMAGRRQVQVSAFISRRSTSTGQHQGYLLITSKPKADVYIDGKQIGRVTSEGKIPLAPGEYEVTLSHPRRSRRPSHVVTIVNRRTKKLKVKF